MNIAAVIYNQLSGASAVTDIVGTKIYPTEIPQGVSLPAVCYILDYTEILYNFGAEHNSYAALFTINCDSKSFATTLSLSDAVKAAMSGYTGTTSNINVQAIMINRESDDSKVDPDLGIKRRVIELTAFYSLT